MNVYLDTAATSKVKPECVYRAVDCFMREVGASPGRSVHSAGIEASRIVAEAREKAAGLFGVGDSARMVFTLNCTEALNLAIRGLVGQGDHVIVTSVEHNSVMRPVNAMVAAGGVTVSRLKSNPTGISDIDSLLPCINDRTRLIIATHASNVTGAIQPIGELGRIARERGIPFLVDAAQTAGCIPIDVNELNVDLLAFSGHKGLMGPQGVGGLYVKDGLDPVPLKYGGTGSASSEETQPELMPDKYESGTPNTPGIAGLGAAFDFIGSVGVEKIRAGVCGLGEVIVKGLHGLDRVAFYGPMDMEENAGVFSFTVRDRDNGEVAAELADRFGIMTRVGLQCAPSAHRAVGTFPEGTIRASIGYFTTEDEVEYFIRSLSEVCNGR